VFSGFSGAGDQDMSYGGTFDQANVSDQTELGENQK